MSIEARLSQTEQTNRGDRVLKHLGTTLLTISGLFAVGSVYAIEQSIEHHPSRSAYETQEQYNIAHREYDRQGYGGAIGLFIGFSTVTGAYGYGFKRMAENKDIFPEVLGRRMDRFLEIEIYSKENK